MTKVQCITMFTSPLVTIVSAHGGRFRSGLVPFADPESFVGGNVYLLSLLFLVDEGKDDPNTAINEWDGQSSARKPNAI